MLRRDLRAGPGWLTCSLGVTPFKWLRTHSSLWGSCVNSKPWCFGVGCAGISFSGSWVMLEVTRTGEVRVIPQSQPHARLLWPCSQLVQERTERDGGKPCRQPAWGHCDMLVRGCRSWQRACSWGDTAGGQDDGTIHGQS